MADFCKDCAARLFGEDAAADLYAEAGTVVWGFCEGCGWGCFDEQGHRLVREDELSNPLNELLARLERLVGEDGTAARL